MLISCSKWLSEKGMSSSSTRPASIFEKSRMSLRICNSALALSRIVPA